MSAHASTSRQSFDLQVSRAPMAVTVDGHRQLVYELHVTNYAGIGLLPSKLEVLDADATGKPLASWAGTALRHAWRSPVPTSRRAPKAWPPACRW
jgi:hypothetical protein